MAKEASGRKRFLRFSLAAGLLGILSYVLLTLKDSGAFSTVVEQGLKDCHLVKGIVGAEDMAPLSDNAVLFSGNDRELIQTAIPNGLFLYNLTPVGSAPRLITPDFKGDPHGLSVWSEGNTKKVFVVVHHRDRDDEVRVYEIMGEHAELQKTIKFPGIRTLNGIYALDAEKFFVSQDLKYTSALGSAYEKYLRRPLGKLFYYDGKESRIAYDGILYANGMDMSHDKKTLFVASMLGRSLLVFDHDSVNHDLRLRDTIELGVGPDNVHVTSDDKLIMGVHPKLLDLKAHSQDPRGRRSPAQVIRLNQDGSNRELIFSSKGENLSAISSGLEISGRILMGAIFDEGFLNCSK